MICLSDGVLEAGEQPEDDDVSVEVDADPARCRRRHWAPDPDPGIRMASISSTGLLDADLLALLRAAASEAFRRSFAARMEGRRRPRPSLEAEEEEESGARASRRRRSTTPCSSTSPPPMTSCSPR